MTDTDTRSPIDAASLDDSAGEDGADEELFAIDPSGLGEYVQHGTCPRYARFRMDKEARESAEEKRDYKEAFQPLSPLLMEEGADFEDEVYELLEAGAAEIIDSWQDYGEQTANEDKLRDAVSDAAARSPGDGHTLLTQVPFAGNIGAFDVYGDSDAILIWPTEAGGAHIRVFDLKASHEEKTYHQIQTACYTAMLDAVLDHETVYEQVDGVDVDAGIIHRETDISRVTAEELPVFDRAAREADVARLLQWEGELHQTFKRDHDSIPHQFDSNCRTCPYSEACYADSLEDADIRLLGLTRAEQAIFREHDIETIAQVAEFIDPVDDPRPYQYDDPSIRSEYSDLARTLSEEHGVGERLPLLAQKAQALLKRLNPDNEYAYDGFGTPYIQGAGDGSLPDDDPHPSMDEPDIPRGSLVRVYLNIQKDHVRDRVAMVSGHIDCTNSDGNGLSFGHSMETVADDPDEDSDNEKALLRRALDDLFSGIEAASKLSGQGDEAPVHLYFYTQGERDTLMDAVKRHPDLAEGQAVRDLLGMRAGVDQQMVSVLQEEVEQRLAPTQPSTGLLPMMEAVKPYDDDDAFGFDEWNYVRGDGTHIDLRSAFSTDLFDYSTPFTRDESGPGVELHLGNRADGDDWYPARGRFGAGIPLEYFYAADGVDALTPEMVDDPRQKGRIEVYQYINHKKQKLRVTTEDLEELGQCFAKGVKHIERYISYKNSDIEKRPIEIDDLDEYTLGDASLARACREYLDLEHASNRSELLSTLRKPMKQRVLGGDAIPIRITNVVEEDGGKVTVSGELMYEELGFSSPTSVAKACRHSGADESSGGDWMVATPVEQTADGEYTEEVSSPSSMLSSCKATLERFDPNTGDVRISSLNWNGDGDYNVWHKSWTLDEGDTGKWNTYIGPGAELVLDEQVDDLTGSRARKTLKHVEENAAYDLISDLADGNDEALNTDAFNDEAVGEFVDWLDENGDPSPNKEQQGFIGDTEKRVSLLQGPPGTGKTSGATSLAILARLYAAEKEGRPANILVTGASNKSIDEVMEDVSEALASYRNNPMADGPLDDVQLVRLVNSEPERQLENVDYADYHNPTHSHIFDEMRERQSPSIGGTKQSTLGNSPGGEAHSVLFTTPTKLYGWMSRFDPLGRGWDVEDVYERGLNIFDAVAADEASMLPLPYLLMAGAFLTDDGQLLVTGDQRQMPPVQRHDWSMEDRRIVEEVAPHLSTLDYLRFLRGDEVDGVPDEVLDASPAVENIPLHQLERTYRCHEVVTDFLRRWVYDQDGINYKSDRTAVIPDHDLDEDDPLANILDPEAPLVLALHDDDKSRQSNVVEAQIATELLNNVPPSETTGVVTPHNAQKGLISTMSGRTDAVDTVERFQGGQRDAMVVSATVSDPDYIDAESEFLLKLNRVNVAASRMKKKLIVVAPRSLFNVIPKDVDEYEDGLIWKGLYHECGAGGDPEWSGSLSTLLEDSDATRGDTNVEVYQKTVDD